MTVEIAVAVYVAGFFAVVIYAGYQGMEGGEWEARALIWPLVLGSYVAGAAIAAVGWLVSTAPRKLGRWIRSLRHD